VETYEERRWSLPSRRRFDPIDVLRYAIEELGHTQAELAKTIGSRARASEILARRRPLTLQMIQKISAAWKISADLLVRPYRTTATGGVMIVLAILIAGKQWSERQDLNLRPPRPERGALPG
jgi:HTH-type transcriptional regulator/antitoxin HigA